MIIPVKTSSGEYDIVLKRGVLLDVGKIIVGHKKTLIVTDSGVPAKYSQTVENAIPGAFTFVMPQGEESKCIEMYAEILTVLTENNFSRSDCVVAVGGGVVGDMAGFCAATYMRGIDFYNIPTTLLSQVDSSIGGKTAIDFGGYKNIVGAFYPPKAVIIDSDTLSTLPKNQFVNGLAESIKMAFTSDKQLFELLENGAADTDIDTVIERSLLIKKAVVEADEKEAGLRKILNFGHTIGHAVESVTGHLHGECVAVGMIPMCGEKAKARLIPLLTKYELPIKVNADREKTAAAVKHDKKTAGSKISIVTVNEIGAGEISEISISELEEIIRKAEIL